MTEPSEYLKAGVAAVQTSHALRWRWEVEHAPTRVWRAITSSDEASQWMSANVSVNATVGGRLTIDWGGKSSPKDCVIVELEHERVLVHTWPMPPHDDDLGRNITLVRWTIAPTQSGATIQFTHSGLNAQEVEGLGGGWLGFLDQFHAVLDGRPLLPSDEHTALVSPMIASWKEDLPLASL